MSTAAPFLTARFWRSRRSAAIAAVIGAVNSASLLTMLAGSNPNTELFAYGRSTTQTLISVYAMRMAAVFTLS